MEESVIIRDVKSTDIPEITAIYNHYIRESTTTFEEEPLDNATMAKRCEEIRTSYPYIVAVTGNKVVGYAYVHKWKEKSAYSSTVETTIYLSPLFTGRGIGKLLMNALISECKSGGFHSLIACITAENISSRNFHENLGFKQVSDFKEVGFKFNRRLDITDYQLII